MSLARRKPEDSAEGCRVLEQADRLRALATPNLHLRESLARSAEAWNARATLLDRLETSSTNARPKIFKLNRGDAGGTAAMAKGQLGSHNEALTPKANAPKNTNASHPSLKRITKA